MHHFESLKGKAVLFLFFIWSMWFINFTGRTIFSPVLPLLEDEFQITHAHASSLALVISGGYACALFFSGIFSAILGLKKSIVMSFLVSAAMCLSIPFVHSFNVLYAISFMIGLAAGIYVPNIIPIITHYYNEHLWGKVIPLYDSAASVSIFSSPFIALFFLSLMPWRIMFIFFAVVHLVVATTFAMTVKEPVTSGKRQFFHASLLKRRSLLLSGLTWVFAAGANMGLYYIMPLYLTKELGLQMANANILFGLSRLGGIVVAVGAGFIVDRFSLKKIIFALLLATGLSTITLTIRDVGLIKVFMFVQASIATGFFPISLVSISRMFPAEERGQATGFIVMAGSVFGIGVIPYLLGLSGDLVSFRFGILALGTLTALSSLAILGIKELK